MPNPFVGRDDLSDYLGQDLTNDDKALICVDAACDTVRTLAEQTFNEVTDEEIVLDGTGTDALLLPERPVIDLTEVAENDEVLVVDDDYKLNGNGILLRMPTASDDCNWIRRTWRSGRQNIAITYSHGYADSDLPRDIRMVALSIAARLFQQPAGGVVFEALGEYQVRYDGTASDVTNSEAAILRKYKQSR